MTHITTPVASETLNTPYQEPEDPNYELGAGSKYRDHPSVNIIDTTATNGLVTQLSGEAVGTQ